MSSGTLLSIVGIMRHLHATPADIPDALDPLCLYPPGARPPRTSLERALTALTGGDAWVLPGWSPALNAWHFFFGMAAANTRIVRRSRHLLKDVPAHFAYYEVTNPNPNPNPNPKAWPRPTRASCAARVTCSRTCPRTLPTMR